MNILRSDADALLRRCQKDPFFFSEHLLGGHQPWGKQRQIMESVLVNPRTIVPAGYAVGKTWVAARIAIWFLYSFPRSIIVTTAPTWRQVENVLWAEIRRQHAEARRPLGGEVLKTRIKITDDWFALGMSTDDPTRFQGFHAAHVLVIFDEAAGVDKGVWDAAEGQMAGEHCRWLAIGNPIEPSGPFYNACKSESWTPNVKSGKLVCPNLVTRRWVEDRRREWGEGSPLFESRVLGQFPTASEHALIPLTWVLEAQKRSSSVRLEKPVPLNERLIGVDVARSGADATVFLLREVNRVTDVEEHRNLAVTETAGRLILFAERHSVPWNQVFVDVIGIGAGVVDLLAEKGRHVWPVNFGAAAQDPARYANVRAECYWLLRESVRPDVPQSLCIPGTFGRLSAELASVDWSVTSGGKILLEPKDKVKQRIGRSPDHADALALTFYVPRVFTRTQVVLLGSAGEIFRGIDAPFGTYLWR